MSVDYVIQHAAPTLAGIKTGNLFPCFFSSPQAMVRDLRAINQVLVPRGLRLLPLRRDNTRVLLYLFRPAALSRDLSRGEAPPGSSGRRAIRTWPNTPASGSSSGGYRLGEPFLMRSASFLGYPPEDVAGFMTHQGKHCKCVGCWKVYGDEAAARRQFAAYKSCTANYCRRRASGPLWRGSRWPPDCPNNDSKILPKPTRFGRDLALFLSAD